MNLCVFGADGRCSRCNSQQINARQLCAPGLGDRVASGLSSIGITKARAQAVAQAVGLEDCGCARRQQLLNELGYSLGIGQPPDGHPPA